MQDQNGYAGSIIATARPVLSTFIYSNLRVPQPPVSTSNSATSIAESDEPRIEITEVRSTSDNERLTFALDDPGTTLRVNLRET